MSGRSKGWWRRSTDAPPVEGTSHGGPDAGDDWGGPDLVTVAPRRPRAATAAPAPAAPTPGRGDVAATQTTPDERRGRVSNGHADPPAARAGTETAPPRPERRETATTDRGPGRTGGPARPRTPEVAERDGPAGRAPTPSAAGPGPATRGGHPESIRDRTADRGSAGAGPSTPATPSGPSTPSGPPSTGEARESVDTVEPDAGPPPATTPPWRRPGFSPDAAGAVSPEQASGPARTEPTASAPQPPPPRRAAPVPPAAVPPAASAAPAGAAPAGGDPDRPTASVPPVRDDEAGRRTSPAQDEGGSSGARLAGAAGLAGATGWVTRRLRRRQDDAPETSQARTDDAQVPVPRDTLDEAPEKAAHPGTAELPATPDPATPADPAGPPGPADDREIADPVRSEPGGEPARTESAITAEVGSGADQKPGPTSPGGGGAAAAAGVAAGAVAAAATRGGTPSTGPAEGTTEDTTTDAPATPEPAPAESITATTPAGEATTTQVPAPAGEATTTQVPATPATPATRESAGSAGSEAGGDDDAATTVETPARAAAPEPSTGPTVPNAPAPEPRRSDAEIAWAARAARRERRRRVLLVLLIALVAIALVWAIPWAVSSVSSLFDGGEERTPILPPGASAAAPARPLAQLPRGGTTIFPNYRVVAYYGTPDNPSMGVLGDGPPEAMAQKLEQAALAFTTPGRVVQPTMELIVHVADGDPGDDGDYSHAIDEQKAWQYLAVARANRQLLVIDIQPGSSDFLSTTRPWERILREPDVGLALDPEWRMPPGQVPGEQIGTVTSTEVNETAVWLANIVREGNLPQKLFVVHQFTPNMITEPERLVTPPELAVVQHVDGFGGPADKLAKYEALVRPGQLRPGFKLFYTQDTPVLSPAQTLGLNPVPDFVTYQ